MKYTPEAQYSLLLFPLAVVEESCVPFHLEKLNRRVDAMVPRDSVTEACSFPAWFLLHSLQYPLFMKRNHGNEY